MKTNRYLFLFLIGLTLYGTINTKNKPKETQSIALIFDLGGVLFKSSYLNAMWEIGPQKLLDWFFNDALSWNIGKETRHTFFTLLNRITPRDPNCPPARDASGLLLPQCMCNWALGKIHGKDLLKLLEKTIDSHPEYFASEKESSFIKALCHITFDPEKLASLRQPITQMWQFIERCKQKGYHVYILSNRDNETIQCMIREYPYLETLTDGILTSAEAGTVKPDPAVFNHFTEKYKVTPQNCIFFDDRIENISAAKSVGMSTVWCYKGKKFKHILEDFEEVADQFTDDLAVSNNLNCA